MSHSPCWPKRGHGRRTPGRGQGHWDAAADGSRSARVSGCARASGNGKVAVTAKSAPTCTSSPGPMGRRPGLGSIGSGAMRTCAERDRSRLQGVDPGAPGLQRGELGTVGRLPFQKRAGSLGGRVPDRPKIRRRRRLAPLNRRPRHDVPVVHATRDSRRAQRLGRYIIA